MITYLYWLLVFLLAFGLIFLFGARLANWRAALVASLLVLVLGWGLYFFYLQQIFVKRWGGVMEIKVPAGQRHIMATWKDDNLWIENYDPDTNRCIFTEYSRGNLLEGKVIIRNCKPVAWPAPALPAD
ncbi:MAG: hypothetical protein D6727_05190 [Gammaproteobacteria bacterium]|nr:MAG: hypothetical protein D6727_05190 [Gammaproteobacteria bacterium]